MYSRKALLLTASFLPVVAEFHPQEYLLAEDRRRRSGTIGIGFRFFGLSHRHHQDPLSIICLQLGVGVLAALISLTGIIAVMTGFAGNTDRHVKTSTASD